VGGVSRRRALVGAGAAVLSLTSVAGPIAQPAGDDAAGRFVESLWPEARAAGVSRSTFDAALGTFTPDPKVIELTRRQGEFSRPIGSYVSGAVSAERLRRGRALRERWDAVFDGLEQQTGVPRQVVLALWAQESDFGAATGGFSVVRSLATLASIGYRPEVFRAELIHALRILEEEKVPPGRLTGSWAGAMGQPQFLPSSFRAFAADGDGDGRRDIWTSVPDVLASVANFMARKGWRGGLPWGLEVRLPPGLDLGVHTRDFRDWTQSGVRAADGSALPRSGEGRLFLPAGIEGPAFLLTENFEAIRAYNTSDAYALAIGHLSDRLAGKGPLTRAWPTGPVLGQAEREEVHRRLAALGLYRGTPDGKFGAQTRDAVRRFQIGRGMVADAYADAEVLAALRSEGR
jgi:lytic murein transglycosylase